jgi:hypothetical protein
MDKYVNYKSARILGYCLNVMGLGIKKNYSFGKSWLALHKAVLAWTRRNYLRVRAANFEVADACLLGSISFDAVNERLVKTYAKGLSLHPDQEFLDLDKLA